MKNLIEKKKFNAPIDENYFARSEKSTEDILPVDTGIYVFIFNILGFALVIATTGIILLIYFNTMRWDKRLNDLGAERSGLYKYKQSKLFSITLSSGLLSFYALSLDIVAIVTLEKDNITHNSTLGDGNIDNNDLPLVVIIFDTLLVLYYVACLIFSCCSTRCRCNCLNSPQYLWLGLSLLGPLHCIVIHLPYILIAFLNDAPYATSMFLYYSIVFLIFFGALDLTYSAYQSALIRGEKKREESAITTRNDGQGVLVEETEENGNNFSGKKYGVDDCFPCFPIEEWKIKAIFAFLTILFVTILLLLIGMIIAALAVIPISKAFSDAPNRLLSLYQSACVFTGAYIAYWSIFKKKPTIESAIKERLLHVQEHGKNSDKNKEWKRLSNNQKLEVFYDHIVEIIVNFDPNAKNQNAQKHRSHPVETESENEPLISSEA